MSRTTKLMIGLAAIVVVVAFLLPLLEGGRIENHRHSPLSGIKQASLAALMYANDHDDRTVPAKGWSKLLYPYVKTDVFRCPSFVSDKTKGGHPLFSGYPGRNLAALEPLADFPMMFDSSELELDAVAGIGTLRFRHEGSALMSFADGHLKPIRSKASP